MMMRLILTLKIAKKTDTEVKTYTGTETETYSKTDICSDTESK